MKDIGYQVFLGGLVVVAIGSVAFGGVGLYWTFVEPPGDAAAGPPEVLGELACEDAPQGLREGPDRPVTPYDVELVTDGDGVTTVERVDETVLVGFEATPFNASVAPLRDGGTTNATVEVQRDQRRVLLRDLDADVRLWVDLAAADGDVVRQQLDVCP